MTYGCAAYVSECILFGPISQVLLLIGRTNHACVVGLRSGRKGGPPLAARAQRGQALAQRNAAALDAASKGSQQAARYSQRLHRMLRLEESAMESDICRCGKLVALASA